MEFNRIKSNRSRCRFHIQDPFVLNYDLLLFRLVLVSVCVFDFALIAVFILIHFLFRFPICFRVHCRASVAAFIVLAIFVCFRVRAYTHVHARVCVTPFSQVSLLFDVRSDNKAAIAAPLPVSCSPDAPEPVGVEEEEEEEEEEVVVVEEEEKEEEEDEEVEEKEEEEKSIHEPTW